VLSYHRTLEIREPSVPLNKVGDLKMLYRVIAADEKNTAVLRPGATTASSALRPGATTASSAPNSTGAKQ
jgi:hypothetical protein